MNYNKKHNETLEKYKKHLRVKEYAQNTIDCYSYYIKLFLEHTDKPFSHLSKKDAYAFIELNYNQHFTVKNQIISSLKLFYKHLLNTELNNIITERPRKHRKLPRVIDQSVLEGKFISIKNLKHRTMLEVGFRCGLRVSEICNLLVEDIDSTKMQIFIRNSKGNKDGYVPMSDKLLNISRRYYKEYRPKYYLFEGQHGRYSVSSCEKIFKKYIDPDKSWHTLRHSYATTLVEKNINMRIIQEAMRHKSSRTTEIYTHIANNTLAEAAL